MEPDLLISLPGSGNIASTCAGTLGQIRRFMSSRWDAGGSVRPIKEATPNSGPKLDETELEGPQLDETQLDEAQLDETRLDKNLARPQWTLSSWVETALHTVAPLIDDALKRVRHIFAKPWPAPDGSGEPGTTVWANIDCELDDKMRTLAMLHLAASAEGRRPTLLVTAGVRDGDEPLNENCTDGLPSATKTFEEMKHFFTPLLGCPPDKIRCGEHVVEWSNHEVTLISGSDLKQTNNEDRRANRTDKFKEPSARTLAAASHLTQQLKGREFILHNLTSAVLPVVLSDEVRAKCNGIMMTNNFFINPKGQLEPVANGRFDLKALHDITCPFVFTHGSFSRYEPHLFGDIEGWGEILKNDVTGPETLPEPIGNSMRNVSRWACQMEAELLGEYWEDYVPHYFSRLQDEPSLDRESEKVQQMLAKHPWIKGNLEASTYDPEKTARALLTR